MSGNIASEDKIRLGVSRCLLGEKVRYDGGQKQDRFLTDTLGKWIEYVGVCPEVECGMTIPREALRLEGDVSAPRLITHHSKTDYTDQMQSWGRGRLQELENRDLCGYIFKSKSPSSGMARIKVHGTDGKVRHSGVGIWAAMFMERFPWLPVEDEGRLHDPKIRENFIERVFTMKRFRDAKAQGVNSANLISFHTRHKLLFMAHSPQLYRETGKLVAQSGETGPEPAWDAYLPLLAKALATQATTKKHVNVLQHAMGYFKKLLSADEKQELLEVIGNYARHYVPLVVPVTLLNHYVRKYDQPYLKEQYYLNPHPAELALRNHV